MSDTQNARLLLTEIATELEVEALVEHQEDGGTTWDLFVDDTRLVQIFLDEESGKVTLSTDLGTPAEEDAPSLHRLLLQYNYLWRETSGTRMALEEPAGNVVMLYDAYISVLDRQLLRNIIQNFSAAAGAWSALLSRPASKSSGDDADELEAAALADPGLFIRV